jgi:hypothetical protein
LFTHLTNATPDHIVYMHWIEPGTFNESAQGVSGKITGMNAAEGTFFRFTYSYGCPNSLHNHGISHATSIAYESGGYATTPVTGAKNS